MKSAAGFFVCMALIGSAQLKLSPTPILAQAPAPPRDQPAPAPGSGGRIIGRVIAADTSNPLANARVQIGSPALSKPRQITTDASGRYEATGLGAGRYKISVSRPGFVSLEYGQTRPSQSGRELELLDGQTLDRIDFALSRGGVINGRITDHNGEPQAGIPMSAQRISVGAADPRMSTATMVSGGAAGNGTVNAKDDFSLVGVHGHIVFQSSFTGHAEPWTLKAVRLGGVDITDVGYNVTSDIDGLEVVMTDRETRVSGTAKGERNQPATDYVVVVLPSEVRPGVNPTRFIQTARPDQQGRYHVKGLPPGQYVAAAVESLSRDGHYNPAFQKRMRSTATPFSLKEGQQLVLDLPLMR